METQSVIDLTETTVVPIPSGTTIDLTENEPSSDTTLGKRKHSETVSESTDHDYDKPNQEADTSSSADEDAADDIVLSMDGDRTVHVEIIAVEKVHNTHIFRIVKFLEYEGLSEEDVNLLYNTYHGCDLPFWRGELPAGYAEFAPRDWPELCMTAGKPTVIRLVLN